MWSENGIESERFLIPLSSSQAPRHSSIELAWLYQKNHPHHINVARIIIKIIMMITLMAIPIILIITMTTMMTNNMFNLTKTIKLPHRKNKTTLFPAFSFAWTSSASEWKVFSDFLHFRFSMCFQHIFSTNVPRSSEMNVPTILLDWIFLDYPSINPIHNPHGHPLFNQILGVFLKKKKRIFGLFSLLSKT